MRQFSLEVIEQIKMWLKNSPWQNPGPNPARQHIDTFDWRFEMKEIKVGGESVRVGYCRELGMIIYPHGVDAFPSIT